MSEFFTPPVFNPPAYEIPLGTAGQVLTMVSGVPRFAAGSGGGGGVGTYFLSPATTGVINNFVIAAGVGRVDIDTTTGNIELTGIAMTGGNVDAGLLIVRNIGANNVILDSENAGSTAANRMQLPGQMFLNKFDSFLLCYYGGTVNRWCMGG